MKDDGHHWYDDWEEIAALDTERKPVAEPEGEVKNSEGGEVDNESKRKEGD